MCDNLLSANAKNIAVEEEEEDDVVTSDKRKRYWSACKSVNSRNHTSCEQPEWENLRKLIASL